MLRVRVAFADTDAMGVAWHGNYLRWFEMARTELMRADRAALRRARRRAACTCR